MTRSKNAKRNSARSSASAATAPSTSVLAEHELQLAGSSSEAVELPENIRAYPPKLARPPFREIDEAAFLRAHPDYICHNPAKGQMPLVFVRKALIGRPLLGELLDGATSGVIEVPPGPLPDRLQLTFPVTTPESAVFPTHILAVPPTGARRRHALFAVHADWVQLHCARPPPLIEASFVALGYRSAALPVVVCALPSPETFHALRTFLYNKNADEVSDYLAPPNRLWSTSFRLADVQAAIIHGVWQNACFLGMIEADIYIAINRAWKEVYTIRQDFVRRGRS